MGGIMSRKVLLVVVVLMIGLVSSPPAFAALRVVLAEEFTGTWCYYCPGAMMGLYNLEQQVGDQLAVVAYHLSDGFTVPGCTTRQAYYSVTGIPTVWFDGVIERLGGNHTTPIDYTAQFNQRAGIPSPLIIDLALDTYDGGTGEGTVTAMIYNEADTTVAGQVRFVATGDDTLYNWQGFDHLYFTALDIFPDAQGVTVSIDPGMTHVETQDFVIPAGWRDRACTIVAFLQNDESKEVQQAGSLGEVTPVELVSFTGRTTKDGVLLTWQTATEHDNAGFFIYRVANGATERITPTMIPGAGTTALQQRYEFTDGDVEPGSTYLYKLSDVSLSGVERFHTPVAVTVPHTWGTPSVLHLEPIRPCPAENEAQLSLSLPDDLEVRCTIYDVSGRTVRTLPTVAGTAGTFHLSWDLTNEAGARVTPGLYVVRVQAGEEKATRSVVVTR
jgi:hypothetical protein